MGLAMEFTNWAANRRLLAVNVLALLLCQSAIAGPPKLSQVQPEDVGMSSSRLQEIDSAIAEAIAQERCPGCVVLIGHQGKIAFFKAYGNRAVKPDVVAMTQDTVFDMASITKPVATATSIMVLLERGKIRLEDKVTQYLPDFGQNDKEDITIQQLLTHTAGLIPDNHLRDYENGKDKAWERIDALKLQAEPGSKFIYTDVGFLTLGRLVETISGKPLDVFARENIFEPLGMTETGYLPADELRARAAVTEQRDSKWMQGEVHDPRAYLVGGVAGHAGLFSTAQDLAVYAQMMLNKGEYQGVRILSPFTVQLMTRPQIVPGGLRTLGWDMRTGYSSNRGDLMSPAAFGHGGFTGTAMWIDPGLDLFVIFLSNRVHPNGPSRDRAVNRLAGRIGSIAVSSLSAPQAPADIQTGNVLTGIDVLVRDKFKQLQSRNVGLVTNHTGMTHDGRSTVDVLHESPHVNLVALFSPEHGFRGELDVSKIDDTRDEKTGLPVYSLYGKTRTPTDEMLAGIDTLVFDIQDIGCRFYTYPATMGNCMQAAAKRGIRFVVLDRPNPINGVNIAGPLLDAGKESFVGWHTIPVRHGLTIGELALLFNAEKKIGVDLEVIRVENWSRRQFYDSTGLLWINPSPNMRNLTQALLYPGIGLLETTNLSVGRGTDTPFEIFGAPWIDGRRLAGVLNDLNLPGVRFVPIEFTPHSSKFANEKCGGVNIIVTDRTQFLPVRTGIAIATQLQSLYPDAWKVDGYARLLASDAVLEGIKKGDSWNQLERGWVDELAAFQQRREPFLLYPQ